MKNLLKEKNANIKRRWEHKGDDGWWTQWWTQRFTNDEHFEKWITLTAREL